MPTYALVTPARDEIENLHRLASCLLEQTLPPTTWIVVDDGSIDGTREYAAELAGKHTWVEVMSSPGAITHEGSPQIGRREGRDVIAFNTGVAALEEPPDFVVKLDADVSFEANFFERLLGEFERDPTLGIAGGECYELEAGEWRLQAVTGSHVRGATRTYRWACWEAVRPLEERLGWDGIDELKAEELDWRVESIAGLRFLHHRPLGTRDGLAFAKWARMGEAAHYMGYRFSYLVLRSLHRGRHDRGALGMIWGYVRASVTREAQYPDASVRKRLRERQSLRRLPVRIREARGRRADRSQSADHSV
jgi:glycosyltransferase involved in cell wall biosynthesis